MVQVNMIGSELNLPLEASVEEGHTVALPQPGGEPDDHYVVQGDESSFKAKRYCLYGAVLNFVVALVTLALLLTVETKGYQVCNWCENSCFGDWYQGAWFRTSCLEERHVQNMCYRNHLDHVDTDHDEYCNRYADCFESGPGHTAGQTLMSIILCPPIVHEVVMASSVVWWGSNNFDHVFVLQVVAFIMFWVVCTGIEVAKVTSETLVRQPPVEQKGGLIFMYLGAYVYPVFYLMKIPTENTSVLAYLIGMSLSVFIIRVYILIRQHEKIKMNAVVHFISFFIVLVPFCSAFAEAGASMSLFIVLISNITLLVIDMHRLKMYA